MGSVGMLVVDGRSMMGFRCVRVCDSVVYLGLVTGSGTPDLE